KALALIEAAGCENVRLHLGDAIDVIDWAPAASFARIDLLYPDPWPKRRHWKRRFVQDQSLSKVANALPPDGEFRFASDIADYAAWTLERALRSPSLLWTAERAVDWTSPWPGFVETRYEAKAKREGRKPVYLTFVRA
ncbi:MAG TPA: tRNA (guanosine(46)-N7)-methyltransferase TrmB, partial [Roseiarcus sp.]|nr:tRNA (guanosine(46)-N7)-methyltransferase TrmB [Roseiarcus sp.]